MVSRRNHRPDQRNGRVSVNDFTTSPAPLDSAGDARKMLGRQMRMAMHHHQRIPGAPNCISSLGQSVTAVGRAPVAVASALTTSTCATVGRGEHGAH
jgi:hypothetical protein